MIRKQKPVILTNEEETKKYALMFDSKKNIVR
jgi:hypothetical protein